MISFVPAVPALVLALLTAPQAASTASPATPAATIEKETAGAPAVESATIPVEPAAASTDLKGNDEKSAPGFCSTLSPELRKMTLEAWRRR